MKAQDSALIGQVVLAHVEPRKFVKHRGVVQRLFHVRVRQAEPPLKEVNAKLGNSSAWPCGRPLRHALVNAKTPAPTVHTRFISLKNSCLRVPLVLRSKPAARRLICFKPILSHILCSPPGLCIPYLLKSKLYFSEIFLVNELSFYFYVVIKTILICGVNKHLCIFVIFGTSIHAHLLFPKSILNPHLL